MISAWLHDVPAGEIDPETRRKMIAEAAYFRAQKAGAASDPLDNWLAAEQEIDRQLAEQGRGAQEEELAAFKRLRQELAAILAAAKGRLEADTFSQALDKAKAEVSRLEGFTAESVSRAAEAVRKEFARSIEKMDSGWHSVSIRTVDFFSVWSRRSAQFLTQAGAAADAWLHEMREKVAPHTFHSGDITSGGHFVCTSCGHLVHLEKAGHLPRCPVCDHSTFRLEP
ncbi:MAG: DUF2934 domain-containing protein [Thermodesulfobacteriota bacterium]